MSTESFESIVNAAMEKVHGNYEILAIEVAGMLGTLLGAHDREIRDTAQQQYHRGFEDGRHSMDAEHRAIVMRLRALPLDGGSHENLSQIARAVYHADFGWTQGACAALRDELVRLMGGVSDDTAEPMTTDEFIEYVEEDTRRLKGDATKVGDGNDTCDSQCRGACADCDGRDSGEQEEVSDSGYSVGDSPICSRSGGTNRDDSRGRGCRNRCHAQTKESVVTDERLADDCADDSRGGDGGGDLHMAGLVAYDVLDNERRKAIAELQRIVDEDKPITMHGLADAIGMNLCIGDRVSIPICMRLIHLLGGDQPSGIDVLREMDEPTLSDLWGAWEDGEGITDELRKFVAATWDGLMYVNRVPMELLRIADRIGERVKHDRDSDQLRIEKLVRQRDEARAKLDAITEALHGEP